MLARTPVVTILIVLSLAIGIGANSAIFSVIHALLLRPLPYPEPERLAAVWLHSPGIGIFRDWPAPGQYSDLQRDNHSFEAMSLSFLRNFTLTGRDQPELIDGMRTTCCAASGVSNATQRVAAQRLSAQYRISVHCSAVPHVCARTGGVSLQ